MKNVLVARFEPQDLTFIAEYSKSMDLDKSAALRELYRQGRRFVAIKMYEEKKSTLGQASRVAGMPISEFMALLEELRIPTTVTKQDVLEGLKNLREASRTRNRTRYTGVPDK